MRLLKVHLRNWCQFEDDTFEFADGVTGIVGTNGVGKSNLGTAIVFAFTGDASRNPGVKNDNIRQQIGPKEHSYVEVDFEHAGARATLKRSLKPSGQELIIEGDKTYTRDAEVRDNLCKILGTTDEILLDYIFVEQWKIFDFLAVKPSARAETFAHLFQVDVAETIWDTMGKHQVPVPELSIDTTLISANLAKQVEQKTSLEKELASICVPSNWRAEEDADFALMQAYRQKLQISGEMNRWGRDIVDLEQQVAPLQQEVAEAEANAAPIREIIDSAKADADKARAVQLDWLTYENHTATTNDLFSTKLKTQDLLNALVPLTAPDGYIDADQYRPVVEEMSRISARITVLKNFKDYIVDGKAPECPTCGEPSAKLLLKASEYEEEHKALTVQLNKLLDRQRITQAHQRALGAQGELKDRYRKAIADLDARLAARPALTAPTLSRVDAKTAIDDYELYQRGLREAEATLSAVKLRAAIVDGKLVMARSTFNKLKDRYRSLSISEEEAEEARNRYNTKSLEHKRRIQVETQLTGLDVWIAQSQEQLLEARDRERKIQRLRALQNHLNEIRGLFHRDALPRDVSQAHLENMRGRINDTLGQLPFRVIDVKDLRFVVRKTDGTVQPAERLSGGEKVGFASAFRVVVNSQFASEMGLLWLDEPTAGLDEDNLSYLEVALGQLRELSKARNMQVIVITHERDMEDIFDRVIKLPLPKER